MTNGVERKPLVALAYRYGITRNPVYVWTAISLALELKQEFPRWVVDYLRDSAGKIVGMKKHEVPEGQHVLESLDFSVGKGKTGRLEEAENQAFYEMLAADVQKRLSDGDKQEIAFENAADEHGCGVSTVRRAFRQNEWLFTKQD